MKSGRLRFFAGFLALAILVLLPICARWLMGWHDFSQDTTASSSTAPSAAAVFRDTTWRELEPENWNPEAMLRELQQGTKSLDDNDPRVRERMEQISLIWANAPANVRMDDVAVRLPGYVVPLEKTAEGITEFLLVPYFGACIHTPPPPANQIVRVAIQPALRDVGVMDAVRVSGVLRIDRSDSELGESGYAMQAVRIDPYTP